MRIGLGIAALAFAALSACGGSDEPDSFDVAGKITLTTASGISSDGSTCIGIDGYDDMRSGASVVVYDSTGKKVAIGELDAGEVATGSSCVFAFEVDDVPADGDIYSVEVANRGDVPFKRAEAQEITVSLG